MIYFFKLMIFEILFIFKNRKISINDNTILVIQLSGIGDAILTLPLLEKLSINNKIIILTKSINFNIYLNQPYITKIIEYNDSNFQNIKDFKLFFNLHNINLLLSIRSNFKFLFFALVNNLKVIPNPIFERIRILSRFLSFISNSYKKNFYKKSG